MRKRPSVRHRRDYETPDAFKIQCAFVPKLRTTLYSVVHGKNVTDTCLKYLLVIFRRFCIDIHARYMLGVFEKDFYVDDERKYSSISRSEIFYANRVFLSSSYSYLLKIADWRNNLSSTKHITSFLSCLTCPNVFVNIWFYIAFLPIDRLKR